MFIPSFRLGVFSRALIRLRDQTPAGYARHATATSQRKFDRVKRLDARRFTEVTLNSNEVFLYGEITQEVLTEKLMKVVSDFKATLDAHGMLKPKLDTLLDKMTMYGSLRECVDRIKSESSETGGDKSTLVLRLCYQSPEFHANVLPQLRHVVSSVGLSSSPDNSAIIADFRGSFEVKDALSRIQLAKRLTESALLKLRKTVTELNHAVKTRTTGIHDERVLLAHIVTSSKFVGSEIEQLKHASFKVIEHSYLKSSGAQ